MIRKPAILILLAILFSCETNHEENSSLRLYGDALEDIGYSIAKTNDGFLIGGQLTEVYRSGNSIKLDSSIRKMGIIRTDYNGKVIWKKSFGNEKAAGGSKAIILNDGSFISTGYIVDPLTNQKDVYVVKVSEDGLSSAEKIYPETGNQFGIDILQTTEGFIILGSTDLERAAEGEGDLGNAEGKRDIYLLRLNNNLEKIGTQKALGYPGNDAAVAIRKEPSGGYIITGTTDNSWPDQALNNIFIFKTNNSLEATKIQILGSADDEFASDIEILEDGYLIAGIVGNDGSDQWVYLTKIPENIYSTPVYIRKFKVNSKSSTATSFAVRAISRYDDGSYVLAGQAGSGASAKMLIFVADAEGNQVRGMEFITSATGTQVAYDVIMEDSGNIVAVGKNSFENNSMISLFKIRF